MPEPILPPSLHYVDDSQPGWQRRKLRGKFAYFDLDGERIRDKATVERLNKLAIPPAYTDVWICPDPAGHLQATGRDARKRKQYRYHPLWRELRDADKYMRMIAFGKGLPKVRKQLEAHLATPGLSRETVMALVVSLLDQTLIRIGNTQYARDNRSYGLTTLRNRHAEVQGAAVKFHFRGKSGVDHAVELNDKRLARIIRRCQELPGQQLFQYLDENGDRHSVSSHDVNEYLKTLHGEDFTAKDYRTWAGSALALSMLRELPWQPDAEAKRHIVDQVKAVAKALGNTPAVCKRCYIHPAVLERFAMGELEKLPKPRKRVGLREEEVVLAAFLDKLEQVAHQL